MNHTQHLATMVTGALLSGGIALAGFGLAAAPAHAGPVNYATIPAFDPQPEPPGRPITATNPPLESPSVRAGFDPQPDPPRLRIGAVSP